MREGDRPLSLGKEPRSVSSKTEKAHSGVAPTPCPLQMVGRTEAGPLKMTGVG